MNEVQVAGLVSPALIIIGKVVALSPFWPKSVEEAAVKSQAPSPVEQNYGLGVQ